MHLYIFLLLYIFFLNKLWSIMIWDLISTLCKVMLPIRLSQAYDHLISYVCYDYLISSGLLRNFCNVDDCCYSFKNTKSMVWAGEDGCSCRRRNLPLGKIQIHECTGYLYFVFFPTVPSSTVWQEIMSYL